MEVETAKNGSAVLEEIPNGGSTTEEAAAKPAAARSKRKRSRSKTPSQFGKDDAKKSLHVNITKLNEDVKGKVIFEKEENGKSTEAETKDDSIEKGKEEKNEITENGDHASPQKDEVQSTKREPTPKNITPKKEKSKRKPSEERETVENDDKQQQHLSRKEQHMTKRTSTRNKSSKQETEVENHEVTDMDPLLIADEPEAELQFEETSDIESGKNSPVVRCATRRSLTRNIPTPKTPKSPEMDGDSKCSTPTNQQQNGCEAGSEDVSNDSTDTHNASTRAVAGGDTSQLEFDDSAYLTASRERSLTETLRSLSARRPIRGSDEYRKMALRRARGKADLEGNDGDEEDWSVRVGGSVKRKGRSITPDEDRKKFKAEGRASPSGSLFGSPLAVLRNRFLGDCSSTPKLLGYRDARYNLAYGEMPNENGVNGDDEKKSWCSVM
ncbi:unnamed protein product [Acanthoscelides obtectus]|nr:unnamed protein product [Acanthoscelides obtectus]CAK1623059.1 hypothetical protein AOBTE_LOCUS1792 [Acanthoscelides obtectus]